MIRLLASRVDKRPAGAKANKGATKAIAPSCLIEFCLEKYLIRA